MSDCFAGIIILIALILMFTPTIAGVIIDINDDVKCIKDNLEKINGKQEPNNDNNDSDQA
jgi:hypothetical protein